MPRSSTAPPVQAFEISPRVTHQAAGHPTARGGRAPRHRPLHIYTLDPSVSARLGGVATVRVPYEPLAPGPSGALFDIRCDDAPATLRATPLDLDDPHLLLSSGLSPTPSDGRFHLQMLYAVCSLTYAAFRRALGRDIPWAISSANGRGAPLRVRAFVKGANAGYSREAGDLSFGYFNAGRRPAGFVVGGGLVCTALSHDIVVHETTHALLDGLRSSFMLPTNVDVPAFHEGFADLVALLLHFTYPDVVERAIRESPDALAGPSLLTDIAREFGFARARAGRGGALRSGVDVSGIVAFDSDRAPSKADAPTAYDARLEPHALGSVLVSAVFEAFVTVVRRKTTRLFRIADLHPDRKDRLPNDALVSAISREACDVAAQFLNVCIRAVDYCPPADIEMGEFLRAMITADGDLEREDKWGFRDALMRSFRRRQIVPDHVQFLTEDAMRWQEPDQALTIPGLAFRHLSFANEPGQPAGPAELERQARVFGTFVTDPARAGVFHLVPAGRPLPSGVVQASPAIVQSVRVARRVTPDGDVAFDTVAEVTQACTIKRRGQFYDMHGGCTVIVDPAGHVRYAIYKRFDSRNRRERQHAAMTGALKAYWRRSGQRWRLQPHMLRRLHGKGEA